MRFTFKYLVLLLLSQLSILVCAQKTEKERILSEMLFVKTADRQNKIFEFRKLYPQDSAGTMAAYREIGAYGRKHGDVLLELSEPSGYLSHMRNSKTVSDQSLKNAIDSVYAIYKSKNVSEVFYAVLERHLGNYYFEREKNYALAFEHYQRDAQLLKTVDIREYPYKAFEMLYLIYRHFDFEDYESVVILAREVLKDEKYIKSQREGILEMEFQVASSFRKLGLYDSSNVYLQKIINETHQSKNIPKEGTAYLHLGLDFYLKNEIEKAKELYLKGLEMVWEYDVTIPEKVIFSSRLAKIYWQEGKKEEAKKYLNIARELGLSRVYSSNKEEVWKNMSFVATGLGNNQSAIAYLDSAEKAAKFMRDKFDSRRFLREQQRKEIKDLENEKAEILFRRNVSLYFLGFSFLISLLFYWRRSKGKQQEIERIQKDLEESKNQLFYFSKHFKEKGLNQTSTIHDFDNNLTLQILEESTILTKEEWETFKYHFEKVYPGFLKNLVKTYPDLTQGELRFLSLKKLGFSNKEMAETLGVSDQSIRTTLHRLRKKVNLSSDDDIESLIKYL